MRIFSLAFLLLTLLVVSSLHSYDPISYCGPVFVSTPATRHIFRNSFSSQFNGFFVGASIGADSNRWNERQLHVAATPPNAFISKTGHGGGYETSLEIGWGRSICRCGYLGARIGYHLFANDHKPLQTTNLEFIRLYKNQGAVVDFIPGLSFCGHWLLNLIIGCEYDQYAMLGYEENSAQDSLFRLQNEWGWALRAGVGLRRRLGSHLALGLEYVHAFPGNVTWPGPLFQFLLEDGNRRTAQVHSNQLMLTLTYYFNRF